MLGIATELGARVAQAGEELDYRVLNRLYDTLAAEFRYLYAERLVWRAFGNEFAGVLG